MNFIKNLQTTTPIKDIKRRKYLERAIETFEILDSIIKVKDLANILIIDKIQNDFHQEELDEIQRKLDEEERTRVNSYEEYYSDMILENRPTTVGWAFDMDVDPIEDIPANDDYSDFIDYYNIGNNDVDMTDYEF